MLGVVAKPRVQLLKLGTSSGSSSLRSRQFPNKRFFSAETVEETKSSGLGKLLVPLSSIVALGGGAVAYQTIQEAKANVPPFDPSKSRYDETTFKGRYLAMYDLTDLEMALNTEAKLKESQALLEEFKKGKIKAGERDAELWDALKVVKSMVHPVTGEVQFWGGRMCAFVPMNTPIALGMLTLSHTPVLAAFWQWANQTINALANYANRSGADIDNVQMAQSYGLGCGVAMTIALGSKALIAAVPALQALGPIVPYFSVIAASTANMGFTRSEEMLKGVPVMDEEGKTVGLSPAAGLQGIIESVVTRGWLLPAPILLVPPILAGAIRAAVPIPVGGVGVVLDLVVLVGSMWAALPVCLAVQPQNMKIPVSKLEPEFQNLKDSKGKPIEFLYANKGL